MHALLTSCDRPDLLAKTMRSLASICYDKKIMIEIAEDGKNYKEYNGTYWYTLPMHGIGQHAVIEKMITIFYDHLKNEKYYLHLEDDWVFKNDYDWIAESVAIMEKDPMVIKVLARFESPHPCEHTEPIREGLSYGYLNPWYSPDGILWHGFSWNPGVTRLDLLKKFLPLPRYEQDLAKQIYMDGYKVVELSIPVYTHIGDGRSTHQ